MNLQNYVIFIAIFGALILLLNSYALIFVKSNNKYWIVCIPLWATLVAGFPAWRAWCGNELDLKEKTYWASAEGKDRGDDYTFEVFEYARKQFTQALVDFWWLLGIQTLVTFILQIIGHKLRKTWPYKWSVTIFGGILVLFIIMSLILATIPSGRII
jgi:hypothetical protein